MARRAGIILGLLAYGAAVAPSFAFEGPEHRDLSNGALEAALLEARPALSPETADLLIATYLRGQRLPATKPPHKTASPWTFGDLVAALDYFQDPSRLVVEGDPLDHFLTRMARRRRSPFARLWALHTNEHHFQGGAAQTYTEHHRRAIHAALAAAGAAGDPAKLHEAILEEAVALHFLEDFFATGHIATPRTGWSDLPSSTLHDLYNRRGLPFRVFEGDPSGDDVPPPSIAPLRRWLTEIATHRELTGPPLISLDDLQAFEERVRKPGQPWTHYGDGRLQDSTAQRIFLLTLVTRSLTEVLETLGRGVPPIHSLQLCFWPHTALPGPRRTSRLRRAFGLPADDGQLYRNILLKGSLEPPQGGVRLRPWAEAASVFEGCRDEGNWWGRYALPRDSGLNLETQPTRGLGVDLRRGWTGTSREVFAAHVDLVLLSNLPEGSIRHRQEALDHGLDRAQPLGRRRSILGHYGLAFLKGSDFDALGLHAGGYIPFPRRHVQISYWMGYANYRWSGDSSTKVHYGLQWGFDGLLGHFNLGAERVFVPEGSGLGLQGDFLYTAGFQLQVPFSWFSRLRGAR